MKLYGKIAIISQTRKTDLPQIYFPLGSLPWFLSKPIGDTKKANKAGILPRLERSSKPESDILDDHACVISSAIHNE
jgi:hypothetical protein